MRLETKTFLYQLHDRIRDGRLPIGKEQNNSIPYRMSFKADQSLSDKVSDFADENFWGAYNIIEPTESLENAVYKLKKQHKN